MHGAHGTLPTAVASSAWEPSCQGLYGFIKINAERAGSVLSWAQKRTLRLRHQLALVTTSHEAAGSALVREVPRSALQTMDDGDAMAASPVQVALQRTSHALAARVIFRDLFQGFSYLDCTRKQIAASGAASGPTVN